MINNNPYIVPQKPLKQSKVIMQPVPLYPHQINRRSEEVEYKSHPQMMKRSTLPVFFESSIKQLPRIPLSPQPMLKGQPLQVSNVSPWDNNRQAPNNMHLRELNERINAIVERLDSQERRLITIIDAKRQQHSTTLSDSTAYTYEPGNVFISKQMEKYSQFQANCQNSTQIIEKLRSEINGFRFDREKYQLDLKDQFHMEMQEQKQAIASQLINKFRESLNQKFLLQEHKINECIQQIVKDGDAKIEKTLFDIRKQIHNQIMGLRQEFKAFESKQKLSGIGLQVRDRLDRMNNSIIELRTEHMGFKDHVFKGILATHHHEEQMAKIKEKMHQLSSHLQKKQTNPYEGSINVSAQKSHHQIVRLNLQHYLTAVIRHQGTKTKINEYNYCIDTQGYLIDAYGYYILNNKNVKIKIEEGQIKMLKEMGILH